MYLYPTRTYLQAHKVEQFKATLDKNHSLHAKYSLSESSLSLSLSLSCMLLLLAGHGLMVVADLSWKQLFLVSVHAHVTNMYYMPTTSTHKSLHLHMCVVYGMCC